MGSCRISAKNSPNDVKTNSNKMNNSYSISISQLDLIHEYANEAIDKWRRRRPGGGGAEGGGRGGEVATLLIANSLGNFLANFG